MIWANEPLMALLMFCRAVVQVDNGAKKDLLKGLLRGRSQTEKMEAPPDWWFKGFLKPQVVNQLKLLPVCNLVQVCRVHSL